MDLRFCCACTGGSDENDIHAGTAETDPGHRVVSKMPERSLIAATDYRPKYHLAPTKGWMNDPNGLCYFNGMYHLFYQYNPYSSYSPGIAHWGHAISRDLFHWKHLPVAMYPDQWYDKNGVFSGSCIIVNNKMHLYYTGNVNSQGDQDQHQYQALATSTNGLQFEKYSENPLINGNKFQPNFRDPKVWKHKDKYYMVLGNSFQSNSGDELGRVLLWVSSDHVNWELASTLFQSNGKLGYMFECPDFFELDGYFVLLFSPQGIKPEGNKYRNLYQTGYVIGKFDYNTYKFTPLFDFKEFDHGHDLYATQSNIDENGNRFVIAWMDMWEQEYPERQEGFTGQMTIPRVITVTKSGQIIQKPSEHIEKARGATVFSGRFSSKKVITLKSNSAEIYIETSRARCFELILESASSKVSISYNYTDGLVALDRGGEDGLRRTAWKPREKIIWKLYIDSSSIELFCGQGEVVFSSRFFPSGPLNIRLGESNLADYMRVNIMKKTIDS